MGKPSQEEEKRNIDLISDYESEKYLMAELVAKYHISSSRIYAIIKRARTPKQPRILLKDRKPFDISDYDLPVPNWFIEKQKRAIRRRIEDEPWALEALERDDYKCVDCGTEKSLVVHHLDESRKTGKLNNDLQNLVTLCRHCHAIRHGQGK